MINSACKCQYRYRYDTIRFNPNPDVIPSTIPLAAALSLINAQPPEGKSLLDPSDPAHPSHPSSSHNLFTTTTTGGVKKGRKKSVGHTSGIGGDGEGGGEGREKRGAAKRGGEGMERVMADEGSGEGGTDSEQGDGEHEEEGMDLD